MRRILVLAPILGALGAAVLPATAQATTTQQMLRLNGAPIDVGPAVCVPGDLVITGQGHDHSFTNPNGDFWENATVSGTGTAGDGFTGHAEAWFGIESNNGASISHFAVNAQGTTANGTSVRIHQTGQFTVNANGVPVVSNTVTNCG